MSDINVGAMAEAINDKADRDLNNVLPGIDHVVEFQLPTSENNYTWYRIYASGWVEQGGRIPLSTNPVPIALLVTMLDTNYIVNANVTYTTAIGWAQITEQTTTTVSIGIYYGNGSASGADSSRIVSWEVKGVKAN